MKQILFILTSCFLLFTACMEKEAEPVMPENISVDTETILLSKAEIDSFSFRVNPYDAEFNYAIGTLDCQVKLENHETGASSTYYRLSSIEPENPSEGIYKAKIRDLNINDRYNDRVVLKITWNDPVNGALQICSEPFNIRFSGNTMFSMSFLKDKNETAIYEDIHLDVTKKETSIISPLVSSPELILTFESNASKITVNGVEQVSGVTVNDFSEPVIYKVTSENGTVKEYKISVKHSGLPVLFIDTPGSATIPSKWEDWLPDTEITLYNTDWTINHTGITEIRGRGNSTWSYPKKPYALKLDKKAEILGMPEHKRWVLLANWMDRTILRNRVAFEVSMRTGLAWTPHGEFVELILNGKHVGNYYICEHIKVDENRVNIDELTDEETDSGYMMELDTYFDEVNKFKSIYYSMPYMFKDPDEVNYAQFSFLQDYVNNMEASLYDNTRFGNREYTQYLDVDSFIDWWFVHELTGNEEPKHPKSSYMHKDKGGKLTMGPVWDFDWGTFMSNYSSDLIIDTKIYYGRLFQDPEFKKKVKERWAILEEGFRGIPEFIDSESARIRNSESMNHSMWPIDPSVIGSYINMDETLSFDDAVEKMKKAYSKRVEILDREINMW